MEVIKINTAVAVIITIVTYILGAITKIFVSKIPNRYIPIQNVIIGFISAFICFFIGLEKNFLTALITCFLATMGAGGVSDLVQGIKKNNQNDVG